MTFDSRQDAGSKLGQYLADKALSADLVLGLPRGGVLVAAEVARCLQCQLDVLVVRKVGHPLFPEFAVGALGEEGVAVLDEPVLRRAQVSQDQLEQVLAEETQRLHAYQQEFVRPNRPTRAGKFVVIVDDGLATGATLEAAVRSARQQGVRYLAVAVPVASTKGAGRISRLSDEFHALLIDPTFEAVGQYYHSFAQTSDVEVLAVLRNA